MFSQIFLNKCSPERERNIWRACRGFLQAARAVHAVSHLLHVRRQWAGDADVEEPQLGDAFH